MASFVQFLETGAGFATALRVAATIRAYIKYKATSFVQFLEFARKLPATQPQAFTRAVEALVRSIRISMIVAFSETTSGAGWSLETRVACYLDLYHAAARGIARCVE